MRVRMATGLWQGHAGAERFLPVGSVVDLSPAIAQRWIRSGWAFPVRGPEEERPEGKVVFGAPEVKRGRRRV